MQGRQFLIYFGISIVITSIGISMWIKHGYDTRPRNVVPVEGETAAPAPTAPQATGSDAHTNSPAPTETDATK